MALLANQVLNAEKLFMVGGSLEWRSNWEIQEMRNIHESEREREGSEGKKPKSYLIFLRLMKDIGAFSLTVNCKDS